MFIKTEKGWKRLWKLPQPEKPRWPLAREPRPEDDGWFEEQRAILAMLHKNAR